MTTVASSLKPSAERPWRADPNELTKRELQVARLVADGLTNLDIANALHVSQWTVATHVAHVLGKLGYRSRAQVAGWYLSRPTEILDEAGRLEALRYYQVLDSEPEPAFDRITALAAKLLRAPIALVSFVDERRQWFKSAHGIELKETTRQGGFCAAAITCETPTVIPDAQANDYFARHPLVVGPPGIRLYAGVPLTTVDGHNLGTLCVMDIQPRELDEHEIAVLVDLAGLVMAQLDQRMARLQLTVSERMRLEARRHAERMEKLDSIKSEFLRLASHELGGPIAVIKGYMSMLTDGDFDEAPETLNTVLPVMASKISEIEWLVDQMLFSARLEDDKLPSGRCEFDLGQVVDVVVSGHGAPRAGLQVELPTEKVLVVGDPDGVRVVVSNLVSNAVKFSPARGQVRCIVRRVGSDGAVDVIDQGIGIAESDQKRLFTRFGRLVTAENSHIQGSGLGLWISRELANRMGGRIELASRPGAGSTFTLFVPLAAH